MKKIIMLFIICLVFCSCSKMYKNDLEVAEYICEDRGGILYVDLLLTPRSKCNDGYFFRINDKERKSYIDSLKKIKR